MSSVDASYRAEAEAGARARDAGDLHEALRHFRAAHSLSPSARSLRLLAVISFDLGHFVDAAYFAEQSMFDERRPLDGILLDEARSLLERSRARLGRLRSPRGGRIDGLLPSVDREGFALLTPGAHVLDDGTRIGIEAGEVRDESDGIFDDAAPVETVSAPLAPPTVPAPAPAPAAHAEVESWPWFAAGGAAWLVAGVALGAWFDRDATWGSPLHQYPNAMALAADGMFVTSSLTCSNVDGRWVTNCDAVGAERAVAGTIAAIGIVGGLGLATVGLLVELDARGRQDRASAHCTWTGAGMGCTGRF